jgi:hypothetical protein
VLTSHEAVLAELDRQIEEAGARLRTPFDDDGGWLTHDVCLAVLELPLRPFPASASLR